MPDPQKSRYFPNGVCTELDTLPPPLYTLECMISTINQLRAILSHTKGVAYAVGIVNSIRILLE